MEKKEAPLDPSVAHCGELEPSRCCPPGHMPAMPSPCPPIRSPNHTSSRPHAAGHGLQDFVGLGMSGTQDNAALYSQALSAVDGLCNTCASARNLDGNYFSVVLPVSGGL